ncbi:NELFE (predicted) [Pycnogonum litorale]
MVYLHFPIQLTEEETMLQKKYSRLKKKKKALQQFKSPKPEPVVSPQVPKRVSDTSYDAKEVAKKLLKSGAISAIKKETKETKGFKRSKTLERRRNTTDVKSGSSSVAGYQPFSSSHPGEEEDENLTLSSSTKPQYKNLYESFVSAQEPEDKTDSFRENRDHRRERPPLPKQGNTVYCNGYGVTEEILRKALSPVGKIINVSMELDKNCGFITFDKMESAEKAISEMNGSTVSNVSLRVSLARRQPIIDQSTESNWSAIAASNSQKGSHRDKRDIVTYEDNVF